MKRNPYKQPKPATTAALYQSVNGGPFVEIDRGGWGLMKSKQQTLEADPCNARIKFLVSYAGR